MKMKIIILLVIVCYGCEGALGGLLTSIIRAPVDAHLLLHDGLNKVVDVIPPQMVAIKDGARHFVNPHGEHGHSKRSVQNDKRNLITTPARIPGYSHVGYNDDIAVLVPTELVKEYNDPTLGAGGHGNGHSKRSVQNDRRGFFTTLARIPGDIHRGVHDGIGGILNILPDVPVATELIKEYNDPTHGTGGHGHGH